MRRSPYLRRWAALLALVIIGRCLIAWAPAPEGTDGQGLYRLHCARCHGEDGGKRKWGAADLRSSVLPDALILRQISKGKGIMPAFGEKLSAADREAVMRYVKSLR